MRYQLDLNRHSPHLLTIHLDRRLLRKGSDITYTESNTEDEDWGRLVDSRGVIAFCRNVEKIKGIECDAINIRCHSITLHKGQLFEWGSMMPAILIALAIYFCPGESLVEVRSDSDSGVQLALNPAPCDVE